ncbi:MAG: NAD(P)/FAD-dependent oxidoreductase [Nitrososphaerota archaeon]
MQLKEWDIIIIGAGPAGLISAIHSSKNDCKVLLLEEHNHIGKPEKCAGLLSISGLKKINIPIENFYIQNFINGAIIKSPKNNIIEINPKRKVAIVVNRRLFDQFLASLAIKKEAYIELGVKVLKILNNEKNVKIFSSNKKEYCAKLAINAMGKNSMQLGYKAGRNIEKWLPAIQAMIANHSFQKDYVHIFFKEYIKGFFGYFIPINEEIGKIGLATKYFPLKAFNKFIKEEFPKSKIIGISFSSIYTGKPIKPAYKNRMLFVGDAAGHVKATTGGGIIFGGLGAIIAGEIASKICKIERENKVFNIYEKLLEKKIYPELETMAFLRNFLNNIPIPFFEKIFKIIKESGLEKDIEKFGDMDFQRMTIINILKRNILKNGVNIFYNFIRTIF